MSLVPAGRIEYDPRSCYPAPLLDGAVPTGPQLWSHFVSRQRSNGLVHVLEYQ
ncbi:hypothetical protein FRC20_002272 [Serendipita sp. 405]|nr:hypothetical protein FRC20_002272 [Serendipita sp. 405]